MQEEKIVDAECNVCEWSGMFNEMIQPLDDEDVHSCPKCKSQNVWFNNQPPKYSE